MTVLVKSICIRSNSHLKMSSHMVLLEKHLKDTADEKNTLEPRWNPKHGLHFISVQKWRDSIIVFEERACERIVYALLLDMLIFHFRLNLKNIRIWLCWTPMFLVTSRYNINALIVIRAAIVSGIGGRGRGRRGGRDVINHSATAWLPSNSETDVGHFPRKLRIE